MKIMKKIFKSRILLVIVTVILTGSISVYAAGRYYASQIDYEPSNPNFNVDNMSDALDELYDKTKNYKNLSTPTDVESNYLLNGKKAYKSNGTLVTGSISTYNGTTNITASSETQTLQTNGKYMNSDITINALPAGSGDCVSGNFVCTTCSTTGGQQILDFKPSKFLVYGEPSSKVEMFYDENFTGNYFWSSNNFNEVLNSNAPISKFIKNDKFIMNSVSSDWNNKTVYYIACR